MAACAQRYDACYGTRCEPYWRDLAKELIGAGVVVQDRDESAGLYDETEAVARLGRTGLWGQPTGE